MSKTPIVFFNASVIISGIYSPTGGSGKLLQWVKKEKIKARISEAILDEVVKHAHVVNLGEKALIKQIEDIFEIYEYPDTKLVEKYRKVIIDHGDAHVLASFVETNSDYLVSLDKRHILVLKGKIKGMTIVSPGELIEELSGK